MVLQRAFITDTGKPLNIQSCLLGSRAHLVDTIGLLGRWFCEGHSSLKKGNLSTFVEVS